MPVGDERAEQLVAGDQRDGDARRAAAPPELRPELAEPDRRGRVGSRRVRPAEAQPLLVGVEQVEANRRRAEQLPAAADDLGPERLDRLGRGDRLGELGEMLELADPQAHLVVEARVLDRAGDERGGRHEQHDLGVGELARRFGVERDRADRVAAAPEDRDRDERLEPLLLELGDVLDARILERVLADERRLPVLDRPPGEPLAAQQLDLADERRVRRGRRAEHELLPVAVEQVDEAGVNRARLREQAHDALEHLSELERRPDRRDDLVEKALLDAGDPALVSIHRF